jgi:hypothetical protein
MSGSQLSMHRSKYGVIEEIIKVPISPEKTAKVQSTNHVE